MQAMNHILAVRIIQGLWLILCVYWFVLAFHNKKTVYRQSWLARLGYILPLTVGWAIDVRWRLGRDFLFQTSLATQLIGIVLCAAGIGFAIWARTILGGNWSGIATVKENHELICRGPYAIVRHPIYTGLLLAYFGTAMAVWPTVAGAVLMFAWLVASWIKSRQEEKLMIGKFSDQYQAYRSKVRGGIIPFLL
jgi:protein-S-isoprenylcysteine O-methyltransferase Ste14